MEVPPSPCGSAENSTELSGLCPRTHVQRGSGLQAKALQSPSRQEEPTRFVGADAARRRCVKIKLISDPERRSKQRREGGQEDWARLLSWEGRKCPNPTTPAPTIWWTSKIWMPTSQLSVRLASVSTFFYFFLFTVVVPNNAIHPPSLAHILLVSIFSRKFWWFDFTI